MGEKYQLPEPQFGSDLTALIFQIERMRAALGFGTTPQEVFSELHTLFNTVMSVVSARIEGNHTTVYEALDNEAEHSPKKTSEHFREISNIISAVREIETRNPADEISHNFIRDLHSMVVTELNEEGDKNPGHYRKHEVAITGSHHIPPPWTTVHAEMTDLLDFSNTQLSPQQEMMQIAIAHHRFVWIHPFANGNGRVARLFTYTMLRRTVFSDHRGVTFNPTSVFGNDRTQYLSALEAAGRLTSESDLDWTTFFAQGIHSDLQRVINLQDWGYVSSRLIRPVLSQLTSEGIISQSTKTALETVAEKGVVKSGDLTASFGEEPAQRSRSIRELIDRKLLRPTGAGKRFYQLSLSRGPIAHRLIKRLDELGYLPKILSND